MRAAPAKNSTGAGGRHMLQDALAEALPPPRAAPSRRPSGYREGGLEAGPGDAFRVRTQRRAAKILAAAHGIAQLHGARTRGAPRAGEVERLRIVQRGQPRRSPAQARGESTMSWILSCLAALPGAPAEPLRISASFLSRDRDAAGATGRPVVLGVRQLLLAGQFERHVGREEDVALGEQSEERARPGALDDNECKSLLRPALQTRATAASW